MLEKLPHAKTLLKDNRRFLSLPTYKMFSDKLKRWEDDLEEPERDDRYGFLLFGNTYPSYHSMRAFWTDEAKASGRHWRPSAKSDSNLVPSGFVCLPKRQTPHTWGP